MANRYTRQEYEQAIDLYSSFREVDAQKISTVKLRVPGLMVAVGHVEFVGYTTTHGHKVTSYRHDFRPGSRPLLCSSPTGQQLFLMGGKYDFTGRGIVDRDAHGRPVLVPYHGEVTDE